MSRILIAAALAVLTTAPALAASDFSGTWKYDLKSQANSRKPNVHLLKAGSYTCSTCVPAYTVKADGGFHKVAGNPYYDEVAVKVVDASTIKWASRKAGKPASDNTRTVSADGKTLAVAFNDMTASNGVAVSGKSSAKRSAAAPAGAHATSGSWVDNDDGTVSDAALLVTMKQTGKSLTLKSPTGIGYTTTIDGPQSPVTGDKGWTSVSLKRTAPNTLVETDYRDGKPIGTYTYAMAADGKSIHADANDILHGTKSSATLIKQ